MRLGGPTHSNTYDISLELACPRIERWSSVMVLRLGYQPAAASARNLPQVPETAGVIVRRLRQTGPWMMERKITPRFIGPLLRAEKLSQDPSWTYDLKLGGFRAVAFKTGGRIHSSAVS
jgi:ATP-dependent DNA ligase